MASAAPSEHQLADREQGVVVPRREVMMNRRASRLAVVAGGSAGMLMNEAASLDGRSLPPPHAWLAIEDTKRHCAADPEEDPWPSLLRGGGRSRHHLQPP
jgi:hypothetical protein